MNVFERAMLMLFAVLCSLVVVASFGVPIDLKYFPRTAGSLSKPATIVRREDVSTSISLYNSREQMFSPRSTSGESLLFSTHFESSPETKKGRGFLRRLRAVVFFPIKLLLVKPIRYLMDLLADEIDLEDGTAALNQNGQNGVEEPSSSSLSSTVLATEDYVAHDSGEDMIEVVKSSQIKTTGRSISRSSAKPAGNRWAVAAPGVDLTGEWELFVTEEFKQEYDRYLAELGQPLLVRSVALGIISLTTEVTQQTDNGKSLLIRGQNVRGTWDRTLVASGTDVGCDEYIPLQIPVMSADSEKVEAESWWENDGTVHVSWLRGVKKYGGGEFESRRYLDGDDYVCESIFHPTDSTKESNRIVWRFRRQVAKEA